MSIVKLRLYSSYFDASWQNKREYANDLLATIPTSKISIICYRYIYFSALYLKKASVGKNSKTFKIRNRLRKPRISTLKNESSYLVIGFTI